MFGPGEAHRFSNAGETDRRCTGYARPANNVEYFLTQLYRSIDENGGKRPGAFDAAFLLTRYGSEFGMPTLHSFVRHVVFPLQLAIGRALRKFEKFEDAPEPVRG